MNPNDISAEIYDLVTYPQKSPEVTSIEIDLVKKLIPEGSCILDIGCGTGRHAIPMLEAGYNVMGIDSSKQMLEELQKKITSKPVNPLTRNLLTNPIKVVCTNILTYPLPHSTFHLATLFWNSFNEICLTTKDATSLLIKLKKALIPDGKILINMDKIEWMKELNTFKTSFEHEGFTYDLNWTIKKFNKKTNVTTSEEKITIQNQKGKSKTLISEIRQRWWDLNDLESLAKKTGFEMREIKVDNIDEHYIVLSHLF